MFLNNIECLSSSLRETPETVLIENSSFILHRLPIAGRGTLSSVWQMNLMDVLKNS